MSMLERQLLRGGHIQLQPAKDGWTRHVNYVPPREVCVAREVVVASTDAASLPTASIVGEEETAEGIRLQVNPATHEPGEVLEEEGRKEGNRGGEPLLEVEEKEGVSSVPSVKPLDEWTEFEVSGWVGTQVGAGRVWQVALDSHTLLSLHPQTHTPKHTTGATLLGSSPLLSNTPTT